MGTGKSRERCLMGWREQFRSSDQPQESHLKEVVLGLWTTLPVVVGEGGDQMAMGFHKRVATLQSFLGALVLSRPWGRGAAKRGGAEGGHGFSVFKGGGTRAAVLPAGGNPWLSYRSAGPLAH
jgi:hypothetical protein